MSPGVGGQLCSNTVPLQPGLRRKRAPFRLNVPILGFLEPGTAGRHAGAGVRGWGSERGDLATTLLGRDSHFPLGTLTGRGLGQSEHHIPEPRNWFRGRHVTRAGPMNILRCC